MSIIYIVKIETQEVEIF